MKAPLQSQPAAPAPRTAASQPAGATQLRVDESNRQGEQRQYLGRLHGGARHGGLPAQLRSGIESLSGLDMSDVRVHRNSDKPAQLQALAYAQGNDIHLGPGQDQHLPHEVWHVVQQKQGRVRATRQLQAALPVNDDAGLEREADVMGHEALRGGRQETPRAPKTDQGPGHPVVQRVLSEKDGNDLEAFFLREIRAIGSPWSPRHRQLYARAKAADTLVEAKTIIREHIAAWHREVDEGGIDWREPGEEESITRSDLARLGIAKRDVDKGGRAKELAHLPYTAIKGKSRKDKLADVADVSDAFKMTPYEESKRRNTDALEESGVLKRIDALAQIVRASPGFAERIATDPELSMGGQIGVYYRYHKFGRSDRSELVFGGFFNKSDIDSDVPAESRTGNVLHSKGMSTYFRNRRKALETLSEKDDSQEGRTRKAKVLEKAQASAEHTPFIATTSTRGYGEQLLGEYPPSEGQYAVMLTILGPAVNTLDFEAEFRALNVGWKDDNYRTNPKRAKDKEQAEFGIAEIFIPVGERSPLGFVIAHVERLS